MWQKMIFLLTVLPKQYAVWTRMEEMKQNLIMIEVIV